MYLQERRLISPKSTAKVHKGWGANTPRGGKIGVVCGISDEKFLKKSVFLQELCTEGVLSRGGRLSSVCRDGLYQISQNVHFPYFNK